MILKSSQTKTTRQLVIVWVSIPQKYAWEQRRYCNIYNNKPFSILALLRRRL